MKKRRALKLNKKMLIALPVAILAIGGIIYAMPDNKPDIQLSSQPTTDASADITAPAPNQPASQQTAQAVTTEPAPSPAPTPPDNPYGPGTNLWRVYDRRAATGKPITGGAGSEGYACVQLAHKPGHTVSRTPTQYAIACLSSYIGFVESVNADGSFVVSYAHAPGSEASANVTYQASSSANVTYQASDTSTFKAFIQ